MPDSPGAQPREDHEALLGLGSNVEPDRHLPLAIGLLRRALSVEVASTAWESPAAGVVGPDYVNAALVVRTPLPRGRLTAFLKGIEDELGRDRDGGTPTLVTIDIDLIAFDGKVLEADLWALAYRAVPVAELLPDWRRPSDGRRLAEVAAGLAADSPIRARPDILPGPNPPPPPPDSSRPGPS